jgi:cardiolipin synthase (CMP-forming)
MNLANAITLLRFALVPAIVLALWRRQDMPAFGLLALSALSDFADGQIARRWNMQTRFGAVADPLADKLTHFSVTVLLTLQGSLPWWFTAAVVARDLTIVGGALAYHRLAGHVAMEPSRISKLNTALQFGLLTAVMAVRVGWLPAGAWLDALLGATLATTVGSGVHYVGEWSRRARALRQVVSPSRAA